MKVYIVGFRERRITPDCLDCITKLFHFCELASADPNTLYSCKSVYNLQCNNDMYCVGSLRLFNLHKIRCYMVT